MNKDEVKKFADLARIEASNEDLEKIAGEIGPVLEYVSHLPDVGGDVGVVETSMVRNVMLEDENPHESGLNTDNILSEAPETEDNLVKVKKIL